ncbi:MAG: ArsR/SmtB family transcription factor [Rhabdochlamydiaceae bacterium]
MPKSQMRGMQTRQLFYALADPTRRIIVELLATNGQMSATDIYENFTVSHPTVSQHLKVLREAELVRLEKRAQQRIYSLNPDAVRELGEWVRQIEELWDDNFDRLDELLEVEKKKKRK